MASLILGVPVKKFESQEYKASYLPREWDTIVMRGSGKKEDGLFGPKTSYIEQMTVREFLIGLGEKCRDIHPDFWVTSLFADYKQDIPCGPTPNFEGSGQLYKYPNWIISDLRYLNEAKAIKDRGGILVRIDRSDNPYPKIDSDGERQLNDYKFDIYVKNESLEGLVESAKMILNTIK